MSNIKTLYTFEVTSEKEVEKIEKVNEGGQEYEKKTKVKTPVQTKFALKLPSASDLKAIRLHFGVTYNYYLGLKFFTKAMIINEFANKTGGILSNKEIESLLGLFKKQEVLRAELQQAAAIGAGDDVKTPIITKLAEISREIFEIEASNHLIFKNSVENKTDDDMIVFLSLYLTHIEKNGKYVPFFEGDKHEQREQFYFKLADNEDEMLKLIWERLNNLCQAYYYNVANNQASFEKFENDSKVRVDVGAEIESS